MNTPDSILIINRMYKALDAVIQKGEIRGVATFTKKHKMSRWNFTTVRSNPKSDMFQVAWLNYLILDHSVSAHWLLTGFGDMFSK